MATKKTIVPGANLSGLPMVTESDLKANDPARLNRVLRLLATQLQSLQTTSPTPATVTSTTTLIDNTTTNASASIPETAQIVTIQGTHNDRIISTPANKEPAGIFFYETDRTVTYLDYISIGKLQVWQYVSGTMIGLLVNRPADLGINDTGFLYYSTDKELTYLWLGSAWSIYNNIEPVLQDTHANRLTLYPSVDYSPNTLFFESDRGVFYIVQTATGTVNTSGTSVTWVSGNHFINTGSGFNAAQWPVGTQITIGTSTYAIASTSSSTALTLSTSAGTHSGMTYTVISGRWVYATGEYSAAYANLPADLGENDTKFVFIDNATYFRSWTWSSAAWAYTVGQPPYLAVQMTMNNTADAGWHAADGSGGVTVTKTDGTTTTVTLPNPTNYFIEGGSYTGSGVTAVKTTINSITPVGSNSAPEFTGATVTPGTAVQSGTGANVVGAPYTPAGTVAAPVFTGTPVTPTVNVEGTPPAFVFAFYVKL